MVTDGWLCVICRAYQCIDVLRGCSSFGMRVLCYFKVSLVYFYYIGCCYFFWFIFLLLLFFVIIVCFLLFSYFLEVLVMLIDPPLNCRQHTHRRS